MASRFEATGPNDLSSIRNPGCELTENNALSSKGSAQIQLLRAREYPFQAAKNLKLEDHKTAGGARGGAKGAA